MFSKKLNWRAYFFIVFFSGVIILIINGVLMLLSGEVKDENDQALSKDLVYFMAVMFSIVMCTYIETVLALLSQIIKFRNNAFYVDGDGIHNTLTCINLFAFVFVGKIKFIPWSAVTDSNIDDVVIHIHVKADEIKASKLSKLIIGKMGYRFCMGFFKPKFSEEEKAIIAGYLNNDFLGEENSI